MSSSFHHGYTFRDGEVVRPFRTRSTNTIGLLGTAGMGPVNTPVVITSFPQALETFGPLRNDGFSILKDLDDMFKQDNLTVVVVNVKDPTDTLSILNESVKFTELTGIANLAKSHVSAVSTGTVVVTNINLGGDGEFALPAGVTVTDVKSADGTITYVEDVDWATDNSTLSAVGGGDIVNRQELQITYSASLVAGIDYEVDAMNGRLNRLSGKIVGAASIVVNYSYVNPGVASADVIGQQGQTVAENTGVYALYKAISAFGLTPKIIGAPSHSSELPISGGNIVLAALEEASEKLGAVVVSGTPLSIADAITFKNQHRNKRVYLQHTQHYKTLSGVKVASSAASIMMAMFAKSDQTRKEGVAASPSNMLVRGVVELVNPVEISLIDRNTQANLLNSNGIGIIANIDGFRTWGNRSTTDDTAFTFINVIRTSDHVKDIIASSHLDLIDRNITLNYELILLQRINGILKNLIANDTLLVGRAYRNPTLNTPESLQSGKFYVDYAIGIPGIAEELIFTAHIVNGYVANIEEIN